MAVAEPNPLPAGWTKAEIERVPFGREHGWREDPRYHCRSHGTPALLHPYTNYIWGCELCRGWTYSVYLHFVRVP